MSALERAQLREILSVANRDNRTSTPSFLIFLFFWSDYFHSSDLTTAINDFNNHAFLYEQMKALAAYNLLQTLHAINRVTNIVQSVGSEVNQLFTHGDALTAASQLTELCHSPAYLRMLADLESTAPATFAQVLSHPTGALEQVGTLVGPDAPLAGPSGVQSRPSSPFVAAGSRRSPLSDPIEPVDDSPHTMVTRERGRKAKATRKALEKEKRSQRGSKRMFPASPFFPPLTLFSGRRLGEDDG